MNANYFCCFDFETSSKYPNTTEIIEIGAQIIEPRTLTIVSEFQSLMQPLDWEHIEKEALEVNHKTIEELKEAPLPNTVWPNFTKWLSNYNTNKNSKSPYGAPIACGYNIINFDLPILRRYCKRYGEWDARREDQKIFNQVHFIDLMPLMLFWTENNPGVEKLSLSYIMEYMGFSKAELISAHNALDDVKATAKILIRFLKLARNLTSYNGAAGKARLEFKGAFAKEE